jgi:integrase
VDLQVSPSTQNQALSALLFMYRELLDLDGLVRARIKRRLPVVMTVEEVRAVLEQLDGVEALVAGVHYRGGLG